MRVSTIVPAHVFTEPLKQCLDSLRKINPPPAELLIVVDGGGFELTQYVEKQGFTAIALPKTEGPSRARNVGAAQASSDILLFLDSDLLVPLDIVVQVCDAFQHYPDAAAIIGSYDDAPGDAGFLSQYRNLQHHYVHQTSTDQVSTFWSGCGAIRRSVFQEVGQFDDTRRWMEDIELGYRLIEGGHHIYLIKGLQVKDLKRWTPGLMLWTDFFGRALPWTELLWQYRRLENNLNVDWRSRASIIALGIAVLGLMIAPIQLWMFALSLIGGLLFIAMNHPFYAFLWQKRGLWFTLRAIPWHMLYYALSGAAFVIGSIRFLIQQYRRS